MFAYATGLIQSERRNMERMSETVTDCNYQSLHHFISNSDWDDKAVFDAVAKDV